MTAKTLTLWHASDDPNIEIFRPHRAPTALVDDELVWAVDDAHLPAYWFPRDCPRATFWVGPNTSAADREWMNGAARVHAIEWAWWDRVRAATIYLYRLQPTTFSLHDSEAGYYVSREAVAPLERLRIDDLVQKHADAGIELRLLKNLWPLWDRVVASTLEFSGIRLRSSQPPETPSSSYALLPR
jgi:hypothetical protein